MRIPALLCLLCLAPSTFLCAGYGSTRNGQFDEIQTRTAADAEVAAARKAGWKLPADLLFPRWWMANPSTGNSSFEYVRTDGLAGRPFVRLDGGGHIASYFGPLEPKRTYIASIKVRGPGTVWFGVYMYAGNTSTWVGSPNVITRNISTSDWVEYRALFSSDKENLGVSLFLAGKGPVDIAEVQFFPGDPAEVEMVQEMQTFYGTGALLENLEVQAVSVDEKYRDRLAEYEKAVQSFRKKAGVADKALAAALEQKIKELDLYVRGEDKKQVLAKSYNEMIILTRALQRAAGEGVAQVVAPAPAPVEKTAAYKPGERFARPDTVTVTDIRSNKVRYNENETATTRAAIVNAGKTAWKGTLVATMRLDLDTDREITRAPASIGPGETRQWGFTYDVGPETYGRAIEVSCVDDAGKVADRWQEYYGVAAEWFRIHQHTYNAQMKNYRVDPWITYYNQRHYFAAEPTDWGVQTEWVKQLEAYQSGQGPTARFNVEGRRRENDYFRSLGVMESFYQTFGYSGAMGYEVIRQHPEFALYDANGQFAVDPIYGGYPNPMEIASPLELGPKRKVIKPYLDRKLTSWQHGVVNYAREDAIRFMAEGIKEYAKFMHEDSIYVDGNLGVWKGYDCDGRPNVPSGRYEDYVKVNARNHNLFSQILKQENPNFGTWYNWAEKSGEFYTGQGHPFYLGSGIGRADPDDASIRAAAGWKNVMFLHESGPILTGGGGAAWQREPGLYLQSLVEDRDYTVQKHGANCLIGYAVLPFDQDAPGASRWAWPTLNYWGAQLIATQIHFVSWFVPSWRPTLQFMTRYSRLIWAPDIKVVPEAEKLVSVKSPEEVWWKRLVYRRKTDDGYDLIVHLVRKPPFPEWDMNWLDEPKPLTGVSLTARLDSGRVVQAYACRPYHYEEDQQVVQNALTPVEKAGGVTVKIPDFRYLSMVVLRVKTK